MNLKFKPQQRQSFWLAPQLWWGFLFEKLMGGGVVASGKGKGIATYRWLGRVEAADKTTAEPKTNRLVKVQGGESCPPIYF